MLALTAAAALCAAAGALLRPRTAHAWAAQTHTDITENALALLEKENKSKLVSFYKSYSEQLKKGCTAPDNKGDIDKGTGTHYYSCATAKGKRLASKGGYYQNRLGDYAKSARTMLEDNYSCALHLYKNDMPEEAMYHLGRALHFLEDISNPAHTANMKYDIKDSNPHKAFEKHSEKLAKKYPPASFDKRLAKSYSGGSFENALNKLSEAANRYAADIATLDTARFDAAVKELASIAAQNAMALLGKFYDDCLNNNGDHLTDGRAYMFINEGSGQIVTVTAKGLALDRLDRERSQKLMLVLSKEGTFAVKAADDRFASDKFKALDKVKDGDTGAKFRFTALGRDRYRISSEASGFGKFLAANRSGSLVMTDLAPGDKSQIWILK